MWGQHRPDSHTPFIYVGRDGSWSILASPYRAHIGPMFEPISGPYSAHAWPPYEPVMGPILGLSMGPYGPKLGPPCHGPMMGPENVAWTRVSIKPQGCPIEIASLHTWGPSKLWAHMGPILGPHRARGRSPYGPHLLRAACWLLHAECCLLLDACCACAQLIQARCGGNIGLIPTPCWDVGAT
jgi:hypothetical protein